VNPAIRVENLVCMRSAPGLLLHGRMTADREEWEYLAKSSAAGRPRDVLGYSMVARKSRTTVRHFSYSRCRNARIAKARFGAARRA